MYKIVNPCVHDDFGNKLVTILLDHRQQIMDLIEQALGRHSRIKSRTSFSVSFDYRVMDKFHCWEAHISVDGDSREYAEYRRDLVSRLMTRLLSPLFNAGGHPTRDDSISQDLFNDGAWPIEGELEAASPGNDLQIAG